MIIKIILSLVYGGYMFSFLHCNTLVRGGSVGDGDGGGIDGWRSRSAAVRVYIYANLPKHIPETFNNTAQTWNKYKKKKKSGKSSITVVYRGGEIWKTTFTSRTPPAPHACGGIMSGKNRIIRIERTFFLYFFVRHVRTPRRHRRRFFMMYTTVFAVCTVCVRVLRGCQMRLPLRQFRFTDGRR